MTQTATAINPSTFPVIFEGWHKDGSDVTLYAVQVLTAYRMLPLAAKGMTFRPGTSPVSFLNRAFGRRQTAQQWRSRLAPVIERIRA